MGGKRVNFSGGGVLYTYDDDKIRRVVRGIITLVTAIFLVLPIIVLYFVKGGYEALVVVVVCTTAVAVVMAITTDCRNHEIMMAAAA
jgi:hypothetical protein